MISATISIGFDVHHSRVEKLLAEAVGKSGLSEPFIQIVEIGNFSVSYKAAGLLEDTKTYLSARSSLMRNILDTLHGSGIEIMSPSFMVQRPVSTEVKVMPPVQAGIIGDQDTPENPSGIGKEADSAEKVIFDKAEEAEKAELEKLEKEEG